MIYAKRTRANNDKAFEFLAATANLHKKNKEITGNGETKETKICLTTDRGEQLLIGKKKSKGIGKSKYTSYLQMKGSISYYKS